MQTKRTERPTRCTNGHALPEPDPAAFTTGYSTDAQGKAYCFPCTDMMMREELREADHYFAYLTRENQVADEAWDSLKITTWTGGILMHVTRRTVRRVGFGGERWYVQAKDVHGALWYGNSPGPGMYVRLHKYVTKKGR